MKNGALIHYVVLFHTMYYSYIDDLFGFLRLLYRKLLKRVNDERTKIHRIPICLWILWVLWDYDGYYKNLSSIDCDFWVLSMYQLNSITDFLRFQLFL